MLWKAEGPLTRLIRSGLMRNGSTYDLAGLFVQECNEGRSGKTSKYEGSSRARFFSSPGGSGEPLLLTIEVFEAKERGVSR